jgi:hypothetical protein
VIAGSVWAAGCLPEAPPPLEPFEIEAEVPLPPNVVTPSATGIGQNQAFDGKLTPDFAHVVVKVKDASDRDQMGVMNLDGSGFTCVTCGTYTRATALEAFPDGVRALVNTSAGSGGGIGDIQLAVLECAPSLWDCQTKTSLPVRFPIANINAGAQNRGAQLHPDGVHLKWNEVRVTEGEIMTLGRLERQATQYAVVPLVVLNPGYDLGTREGWIAGGRYYELGEWIDGGRGIKYGTTTTAGNYDIWEVDLATGARRQITQDVDYNELYDLSPDGETIAYSSPRGLDRMKVFSQLVRPAFLEVVSFPQLGRVGLWNNRRCMNERWLMDRAGQRGGYAGQPIVTEDNWVIRGWSWFPDGTRALVAEERLPNEPEPSAGYDRARLRVLRFPARAPTTPLSTVSLADVDLSWAVPYGQYTSLATQQIAGQVVPGAHSGTATITYSGNFAVGFASVTYDAYSDDGLSFVNGTETVDTPLNLSNSNWLADLTISGVKNGHLVGELNVSGPGSFSGYVESDVDGAFFDHVPTQADCPGVFQPPLVIESVLARPLPGDRTELRVRVTAEIPEDPHHRPVRLATVQAGGETATTDAIGWAVLSVANGAATSIEASAGGFVAASAPLP